jgi:hypothetical protein
MNCETQKIAVLNLLYSMRQISIKCMVGNRDEFSQPMLKLHKIQSLDIIFILLLRIFRTIALINNVFEYEYIN